MSDSHLNGTKSNGTSTSEVKTPFLIGVAGGTASGKSTVCKRIMEQLGQADMDHAQRQVVCISQDSFYRDLTPSEKAKADKGMFNFDHPDAFNEMKMLNVLRTILAGQKVTIESYDYRTNALSEKTITIYPADVVLFEGILVFYFQSIRDLFHMKLFVDTDSDTRLARRDSAVYKANCGELGSMMWKICSVNKFIVQNGFLRTGAYYSKDSKSKELLGLFKLLTDVVHNKDDPLQEGGPNWELFNPKGNRFFLPNSTGLAWQNPKTVEKHIKLENLIDFNSKAIDKFHLSSQPCPALIKVKVKELFPNARTIITLSYQQDTDVEYGARNFVLAATEICRRLQYEGYACDFYNPFSGKPFFASYRAIAETNREADHGFTYEKIDNCTVMSDVGKKFSGIIFTDAQYEPVKMKKMIQMDIALKMILGSAKQRDDYEDGDESDYDDGDDWR